MSVLVALAVSGWVSPAVAASLRTKVELHADTVKLSDLFYGLLPGQDCDIGPAPAPGKHVVVPPNQLAAIASEFGVDWQPGPGYMFATIMRPARLVTHDEILALLKPALLAAGASTDSDISLADFASPDLPVEASAPAEIQRLDYDTRTGRFSAELSFAVPNEDPESLHVTGRAARQVDVLTLARSLPAATILSPLDLQVIRMPADKGLDAPLNSVNQAVGLSLRRPVREGVPLLASMLVRPVLVERGRPVVLRLVSDGLNLTAAGTALEPGGAGDRIHVINSVSHSILVGEVLDGTDIEIDPGTTPTVGREVGGGLPQLMSGLSSDQPSWARAAQEAANP